MDELGDPWLSVSSVIVDWAGGSMKTSALRTAMDLIPPRLRVARRAMCSWYSGEPELRLLPYLIDSGDCVLDVGANYGVYSWHAALRAQKVIAFEPQPTLARFLQRAFGSRVQVEQTALSDRTGEVLLRIPNDRMHDGLATVEVDNDLGPLPVHAVRVPCRRLDDYGYGRIGFMKIDVEGHELAVINGGWGLLSRDLPHLLIEAEDRHRKEALPSLSRRLGELGYTGFFLRGEALMTVDEPIGGSDIASYVSRKRIFNFVFLAPRSRHERIMAMVEEGRVRHGAAVTVPNLAHAL
ncbi:FkbM family methyltransferase (plasmid) [Paracoccus liaowanqingii]|uniref:FkbM family methyltransferase n=1 Tax=Paracoccus liaowanqingii TaxID=2560053 RepID=A0A4Y5SS83_9RHOB|nr:FkbM family methyltransferase [Paracoccus liaowanqingii]QDA35818.1 FkbM family methyltransferase [Paracoccus liaowanqingii]